MLDDAGRPDERAILAQWLAEFRSFVLAEPETEKGCAVLTRPAA